MGQSFYTLGKLLCIFKMFLLLSFLHSCLSFMHTSLYENIKTKMFASDGKQTSYQVSLKK